MILLAQLVEHNTFNVGVLGLSPAGGSHKNKAKRRQERQVLQYQRIVGLFYCFSLA